jgi:hypothetical protein
MNPNPETRNDWLATKIGGGVPEYENLDRATKVLSHWMVGYDELEIAAFFEISEIDVKRDLEFMRSRMTARQIIAMDNDRHRILIHRQQSRNYSNLLEQSLTKPASYWIENGLSPVPALKEYRQAVGLEEKPGGVAISVTKQSATFYGNAPGQIPAANLGTGKPKSFEDLLRMIIAADPSCGLQPVIDTDAHELPPSPDEVADESPDPAPDSD